MPWELLIAVAMTVMIGAMLRPFVRVRQVQRDYGLLREVATAPTQRAAGAVVTRLRDNGIRVTTAESEDGERLRIMVFQMDERRAIELLLEEGWPPPPPPE